MAGAGLEGIVAGQTSISTIDGKRGVLTYRGMSIHDVADHCSFEECTYLLWFGRLPKKAELDAFQKQLWAATALPAETAALMKQLPADANPMSILQAAVAALALSERKTSENNDASPANGQPMMGQLKSDTPGFGMDHPNVQKSIRLTAQMAPLVAAIQRVMKGQPFVEPTPGRSIAFNFLRCMTGKDPDAQTEKMFDKCLVLHADHEFNASTFTARVAAGTLTDPHSAVVAAIGALKGPLHGGANTAVAKMLLEIKDPKIAKEWVKDGLEKKKKIMGFGHRMYKTEDPRATHLRKMSEELCKKTDHEFMYLLSREVEAAMLEQKHIYPNVDFYSASVYFCMGIDLELYTPIFALSRVTGWLAHILEQLANNRLIRPEGEYVGPVDVPWVPIENR
jgi:citrate synthase